MKSRECRGFTREARARSSLWVNGNSCFFSSNYDIIIYKFPNDQNLRNKWIYGCGISKTSNVDEVSICPTHFAAEHIQPRIYNLILSKSNASKIGCNSFYRRAKSYRIYCENDN